MVPPRGRIRVGTKRQVDARSLDERVANEAVIDGLKGPRGITGKEVAMG